MKKSIAQGSIFLFLLYLLWYAEAFDTIATFLYGGTILVMGSTALYMNGRKWSELRLPSGLQWWVLFGLYSLLTGLVVATDRTILISALVTFFSFLIVIACISFVAYGEGQLDWLLKQIAAISIVCALYTLFRGFDYYNGVIVRTMGPGNNPNTLGVQMVFGTFCLLYISRPILKALLRNAAPIALFAYVIVLTGSKKALLAEAVLIFIWVIALFKGMKNAESVDGRLCAYGILVLCVGAIAFYFAKYYINTASFARMQTLNTSGSTATRTDMYREAFLLFKRNPIFGIGYSQFRVVSSFGTYSHSTYAELIADTGAVGTLIFIYPILLTGKKLLVKVPSSVRYRQITLISLYIVEIFLGAANIFFYDFTHLLIWTVVFFETGRFVRKNSINGGKYGKVKHFSKTAEDAI